jgi:predicted dehydrogenase
MHAPLVEAFAKQGYHILCEKPMATTIEECVDMVKQVQAAEEKRVFGIGHGMSFKAGVIASIDQVASPAIFAIQPGRQAGHRLWRLGGDHQHSGEFLRAESKFKEVTSAAY